MRNILFYRIMSFVGGMLLFAGIFTNNKHLVDSSFLMLLVSVAAADILTAIKDPRK